MKKTQTGFTLLDLLVTLAVFAIVVAIGIPGLNQYVEANRSASQNNLIVGTLTTARSEAIKRGIHVVVCASSNSTASIPACDTNQWELGWIFFADMDQDGVFTPAPGGKDVLLGVSPKLNGGITIRTLYFANQGKLTFYPNGALAPSDKPGTFKICSQDAVSNAKKARAVNVFSSGLINIASDTDKNYIVNDINNQDVACP